MPSGETTIVDWVVVSGNWQQDIDDSDPENPYPILTTDIAGRLRYDGGVGTRHLVQVRVRASTTDQVVELQLWSFDHTKHVTLRLTVGGGGELVDWLDDTQPVAHELSASLAWTTVSVSIRNGQLHYSGGVDTTTIDLPVGFTPSWFAIEASNLLGGNVDVSHLVWSRDWTIITGDWRAEEAINGSGQPIAVWIGDEDSAAIVATASYSGAQKARVRVTASVPHQVIDLMLGCDAAGSPQVYVRLTFGDASEEDTCGTIQLFGDAITPEAAQPVLGLRDGVPTRVTLCVDAELARLFVEVVPDEGGSATPTSTASALIDADPEGRLGWRLVDGEGGSVAVTVTLWEKIFTRTQTCQSCDMCGTLVNYETGDANCVRTASGPVYYGEQLLGFGSVTSLSVISALDRRVGFGVEVNCGALQPGGMTATVHLDDTHSASLTIGARYEGPLVGGSPTWRMDVSLAVSGGGSSDSWMRVFGPEADGLPYGFVWSVWFCGDEIHASVDEVVGTLGFGESMSAVSGPADREAGEGSPHATASGGGVGFTITRCLHCGQCEKCQEPTGITRVWQVEIEGTPDIYDGTYLLGTSELTGSIASCDSLGNSEDTLLWELQIRRHRWHLGVPAVPTGYLIEGESDAPITDCNELTDEVIQVTGLAIIPVAVEIVAQGGAGQNEIVTVTISSPPPPGVDGFKLVQGFHTSAFIPPGADADTVQAILEALPSIGVGNVAVTGDVDGPWTIEFVDGLAETDVSDLYSPSGILIPYVATATVTAL